MATEKFLTDSDYVQNAIRNALLDPRASDPSTPVDGQVWYNSTTKHLYVRANGTTYQLDQQSGGGGGLSVTTKGDLQGFDTAANRVPVGANGTVLVADSTQALGVKYKTPSIVTTETTYLVTNANEIYHVSDDNFVDFLIVDTTKPAAPQYTRTVVSGDIPTATLINNYCTVVTIGGKNTDAANARTINWRLTLNGAEIDADYSLSITANDFWEVEFVVGANAINVGDVIGVKFWASLTNVIDARYATHYFFPRQFRAAGDNKLLEAKRLNSSLIITGAIAGVTYLGGNTLDILVANDAGNNSATFLAGGPLQIFVADDVYLGQTSIAKLFNANNGSLATSGALSSSQLFRMPWILWKIMYNVQSIALT